MLSVLIWLPLAVGLAGLALPRRATGWWAALGTLAALVLAIVLVAGFDPDAAGLQHAESTSWIPGLGVSYSVGVDGISIFLVLLTTVLWAAATAFAALRELPEFKLLLTLEPRVL